QITMNDAPLVRRFKRFTDAPANIESFVKGNGTMLDVFRERLAFHEFKHQESRLIRFLQIIDGGDIRMIERGENFSFALETAHTLGIARKFAGQNLDRDITLQFCVTCAIYLAHSAPTENGRDFERAKSCTYN